MKKTAPLSHETWSIFLPVRQCQRPGTGLRPQWACRGRSRVPADCSGPHRDWLHAQPGSAQVSARPAQTGALVLWRASPGVCGASLISCSFNSVSLTSSGRFLRLWRRIIDDCTVAPAVRRINLHQFGTGARKERYHAVEHLFKFHDFFHSCRRGSLRNGDRGKSAAAPDR